MIGPLPYIGGKRRLAKTLIGMLPPHVTYVEPFCGGAQVFFHKPPSRVEVLNDVDGEVVNFLRICREHPQEMIRLLEFLVPSRAMFAQFADQNPACLTDIQRAVRFFYLQKLSFGGRTHHRNLHYGVVRPSNLKAHRLPAVVRQAAERLRNVQVEQLPYERILERYDRQTTFFYLDPPYAGLSWYRQPDRCGARLIGRSTGYASRAVSSFDERHALREKHVRPVLHEGALGVVHRGSDRA